MTDILNGPPPGPVPDDPPAVPSRNSEMPTSEIPAGGSSPEVAAAQSGSPSLEPVQISEFGPRERAVRAYRASRAYWTPPMVFTRRPASLQELHAYARTAPWTPQERGFVRAAGVAWYRFAGFPLTVLCRYLEWFAQRPLRAFALAALIKIISLTGPGHWAVQHLVYPAARIAGQIFL